MANVSATTSSINGNPPANARTRLLDRPLPRKLMANSTKKFLGDWLPLASRVNPKILKRLSGFMNQDDFAVSIAVMSDENLEAMVRSPLRLVILDEIVSRMEGEFMPERAHGLEAVFHFLITGRPDGGNDAYQMTIANDTCVTGKTLDAEPKIVLTLDAASFLKLVTGVVTGVDLYIGGKLKIDGAMLMGTRIVNMFNIPTAAKPVTSSS